MTDWNTEDPLAADREPWPPSVMGVPLDEDAIWDDLCDNELWMPLRRAVQNFGALIRSPAMIGTDALDIDTWNGAQATVLYEVERLHVLLLARQLCDAIKETAWEEPLASLLRGLDAATASAIHGARALSIEMNEEVLVESVEEGTVGEEEDDEDSHGGSDAPIPEWGRGYAYVLYRRYLADLWSIIELREAVCAAAYAGDDG